MLAQPPRFQHVGQLVVPTVVEGGGEHRRCVRPSGPAPRPPRPPLTPAWIVGRCLLRELPRKSNGERSTDADSGLRRCFRRPGRRATGLSLPAKSAERDRVPQGGHRRDAVLPRRAGAAGEKVGRARRQHGLIHTSLFAHPPLEAQQASRPKRDADHHGPEHRGVPVPADGRTGGISRHQRLRECCGSDAGELGAALAQPLERLRKRFGGSQLPRLVAVFDPAPRHRRQRGRGAARARDDAATKGQLGRQKIFDGLLTRLGDEAS